MLIGQSVKKNVTMMIGERPQWTEETRRAYLVFWTLHAHFIGEKELHPIHEDSFVEQMGYGNEEGERVIQDGLIGLQDMGYILLDPNGWIQPMPRLISMYNGDEVQ